MAYSVARIIGGYTFVPPGSMDFNGTLISVSCGGRSDIVLSPWPAVDAGQFSFRGTGGAINGGILSPADSEGRIDIPPCSNVHWYARKR